MVYKRKRSAYGKGTKGKFTRARYGRGTGSAGRSRRTKPYAKRSFRRATTKSAHIKKMVRSKKPSSSGFRKAVIRALASTNTYVIQETQRVTWNAGTKASPFAYPVGGGAWAIEYWPPDMLNDITSFVRQQESAKPWGDGIMDFSPGSPLDCYVTKCTVTQTISSCYQVPVYGRWWCFESRYDGNTLDPPTAYSNEINFYQGSIGGLTGVGSLSFADLGSTPYNFKALCTNFKIRPMSKLFKLYPNQPRTFKHTTHKMFHVTDRLINLDCCKLTKYFAFEFYGTPVNDAANKTFISTSAGIVDIITVTSSDYEFRPMQNRYKDINFGLQTITTPSVMVDNTNAPTTAPTSS